MDPESHSIVLGGRAWRCAVDPPEEQDTPPVATADDLAATFAAELQNRKASFAAAAGKLVSSGDEARLHNAFVLKPDTGAKLVALCVRARQAHPTLVIDRNFDRELVIAMAARATADLNTVVAMAARAPADLNTVDAYLERCHPADLALALAAGRGVAAAITEIERIHRTTIDSTCCRFASPVSRHTPDDLKHILRTKLFVGDGNKPAKIADYAGQGLLESWLRVTAVRIFLDLAKGEDRTRVVGAIKAEHRDAVTIATHEAAKRLPTGDRHLLFQHFVAGVSIDQLGAVLGIHRCTAARRITRAREQLLTETRNELATRLALTPDELDEVLGLVMRRLGEVLGLVMRRLDVSTGKLLVSGR